MNRKKLMILILSFMSLSSIPIANSYLVPVQIITMMFIINWWVKNRKVYPKRFFVVHLYLLWATLGIFRGLLVASNYTEYRQLVYGSLCTILPLIIWLFYDPLIVRKLYRLFIFPIIPVGLFFASQLFETGSEIIGWSFTFLFPLSLLIVLLPHYKKKWQFLIIVITSVLVIYNLLGDNKFICVAYAFALLIGICSKLRFFDDSNMIRYLCYSCYAFSIFIFSFVLVDIGNVYIKNESKDAILYKNYISQSKIEDTRSLIYIDVINSAIDNKYVLFGHTPARGNTIDVSGILFLYAYEGGMNDISFNHGERFSNEAAFLNIFTWLGLVGLILYSIIYFRASYLALVKSNNKYIKLFGCMVGGYWSLSFIGAINNVDLINFGIWSFIGVCYSDKFRQMSNQEFNNWVKSFFNKKYHYEK